MSFDLDKLVRENIRRLDPYSSARSEFQGAAEIFLDANENSFGSPLPENYNRYPDPLQVAIKQKIAELNGIRPAEVFVGNGSDEAIDLLFRVFCCPQTDDVLICPPTYGMYEVAASINDVAVRRANLTSEFELDPDTVRKAVSAETKIIFICSPNNPTGNSLDRETILEIAEGFDGIVVVDEAYIHFSNERSLVPEINSLPNLVVLQTFSKAWGLAGLRVGSAFANEEIVMLLNKVKPPYNVSRIAQEMILAAFQNRSQVESMIAEIKRERQALAESLKQFSFVAKIYRSDANFLFIKTTAASEIYRFLINEKIVVRNRGDAELCEGCLRITVGTPKENQALLKAFEKYETSTIY